MKKLSFVLLTVLFLYIGCFDIFTEQQEELIGNISVVNPNNQEDKGYKLIIYEEQINKNVIEGYVIDLNGNDSTLFVKAIGRSDCDEHYYAIKHKKGETIINVEEIDPNRYSSLLGQIDSKIHFQSDKPDCP